MNLRRSAFVTALFGVAVLLAACKQAAQVKSLFASLMAVRKAIQDNVGAYDVNINVTNGSNLSIIIVNSPLHNLPSEAKDAKAKELAQLGYDTYADRDHLQRVLVVFLVSRTYWLIFHMNDGMDAHAFDAATLREAQRDDKATVPGRVR